MNKNNHFKYYLRSTLYSIALIFTSTSVIQIFLTNLGVKTMPIGIFTSLLSVINVLACIIISSYADRCKNVKGLISILFLPIGGCLFLLIPLCFASKISVGISFFLTAVICLIQMLFISLASVLEYKLPYSIIDIEEYGRFFAINGIITGIVSTAISYLLSVLLEKYPYFMVIAGGFALGGICMLLAAWINQILDTSRESTVYTSDFTEQIGILTGLRILWEEYHFRRMIFPNFLRGIHMGMINVIAVIALGCELSIKTTNQLVTVTFLGNILGSTIYSAVSRQKESRILCMVGSLITCIALLLPFCSDNLFLVIYFITIIGKIMIDYAVPSCVYTMIRPDIACLYQTWRLIITTAGSVFSAALSGIFMDYISIESFLFICTGCQMTSGVYYLYWKKK